MRYGIGFILVLASTGIASADAPITERLCNNPDAKFHCYAQRVVRPKPTDPNAPSLQFGPNDGLTAAELQDAYKIDVSKDPGATIAIVDAYGYPTLEADLAEYRSAMGLSPCTKANGCLKIINQRGGTTPPGNAPANDDWTGETALDMDMASAACPKCKILIVQADNDFGDNLEIANDAAAAAGATVVSNSWGSSNANPSAQELAHFNHPGMAIFVSSGDFGAENTSPDYPAADPNVIAVGGTSLRRATNTLRGWGETAWDGAGSSCATKIAKPSWQKDGCQGRATSDISAVADPATGVSVFNQGSWAPIGGTSASSPLVAAIFALTGHGTVKGDFAYANPNFWFDVTDGDNLHGGCTFTELCTAGAGWDGPTGLGSPNVPSLAGAKAPTLALNIANGQAVPPGFDVTADCTSVDDATIKEVDIQLDGQRLPPLKTAPFTQKIPKTITNGSHTIAVACTTSALATTNTTVKVVQVASCDTSADCPKDTDVCFDNACIAGPDAGDGLGTTCTADGSCASADCVAVDGGDKVCVVACDSTGGCPSDFHCDDQGDAGMVCIVGGGDGGGGCNSSGGAGGALLGLGLAALLVSRRRARA